MTVMQSIKNVLTEITTYFVDTFGSISDLFYNSETGLTFVGTLGVMGLGIGVTLLVVNYIRRWIRG